MRNEIFRSVGPTESVDQVLEAVVIDVVYLQVIKCTPVINQDFKKSIIVNVSIKIYPIIINWNLHACTFH